jgi:VanZ family protein
LAGTWALFVWVLGSESLSLEGTSRFLGPLLRWLLPGVSDATHDMLQLAIRKLAHVTEYGLLAFFVFRASMASGFSALPRGALGTFAVAAAFAAADETHQSLSATRLGSIWDVALDALGAGITVGLLLWIRIALPRLADWLGLSDSPIEHRETTPPPDTTGLVK